MIHLVPLIVAAALQGSASPPDTARPMTPVVVEQGPDTVKRRRPKAVELSDWYGRRLTIHRVLSYVSVPVFAAQYVAGDRLFRDGSAAPEWAKTTHRVGATTLAGIFTVNTVTGLWNLWESRAQSSHRALRTTHALMMLAADGAFTYAGVKLAEDAEQSQEKRKLHRTIALSATGLTLANGIMMKLFNK